MAQDAAIQLAETLQTAHINRHPSPSHDLNPSSSASFKQPVELNPVASLDDINGIDIDADTADGVPANDIPHNILRPAPRRAQIPPLPDLRFEQSYLASIKDAENWTGVAFITLKDHVVMPLLQGTLWTLMVCGFRAWNTAASLNGQSAGARIRRWWWGVNNWTIPKGVGEEKYVEQIQEFYEAEFGGGGD